MAYIIKATILGVTKPPVWRKFRCGENATFGDFARSLRLAFGWSEFHLHEFRSSKRGGYAAIHIGPRGEDDWIQMEDENEIRIEQVFGGCARFYWNYDFGDDWLVELTLDGQEEGEEDDEDGISQLDGKGMAPAEDCGGPCGWQNIKHVLLNEPESGQAKEYREWLGLEDGEAFDPNDRFHRFG